MLDSLGLDSIEHLISETIPNNIRLKNDLNLEEALSENEFLTHIEKLSKK
jgi:glycine dehydrogenase